MSNAHPRRSICVASSRAAVHFLLPARPLRLLSALALGMIGCDGGMPASGTEVSVGRASAPRDLMSCFGSACAPSGNPISAIVLDEEDPRPCQAVSMGKLVPRWQAGLPRAEDGTPSWCGNPGCTQSETHMTLAGDGTAWLVAAALTLADSQEAQQTASGAWLGHYDATGSLLSEQTLDHEVVAAGEWADYQVNVAPGPADGVFVSIWKELAKEGYEIPARQRWLTGYGPDGLVVGEPIALDGEYRSGSRPLLLWPLRGGALAVASGERLAVIDADHSLRWVQTRQGLPSSMASDADGAPSVFTATDSSAGEIEHYDRRGQLTWRRSLVTRLLGAGLSVDGDGNPIRSGFRSPDPGFEPAQDMLVHKLSAGGESLWNIAIPMPPDAGDFLPLYPSQAVVDSRGQIFLVGPPLWRDIAQAQLIYEISDDGRTCLAYEVEREIAELRIGPDDTLYILSSDSYSPLQPE